MPRGQSGRATAWFSPAVDLPPPFRLKRLRESGDAFAHACVGASALGAGTLVVVGGFNFVEFAIVLEPDQKLTVARSAFYAGMIALGDALAAAAPPEKPVVIDWPDAILIDGGLVGGGRLAWPEGAGEDAVPDWLVFGTMLRAASLADRAHGASRDATALADEGFGEADLADRLAGGFARHLMVALDHWSEAGLAALGAAYAARLRLAGGARCSIDEHGDLLIRRPRQPLRRRPLRVALATPSWLDPQSGEPRLA